jgi:hypothetical protein
MQMNLKEYYLFVVEYCDWLVAMGLIRIAQFLRICGARKMPLYLLKRSDKIRDKYVSPEQLKDILAKLAKQNQNKN